MWEIAGVIVAILALIASAIFYFKSARQLQKSTRRLQNSMNVLGRYLKATIKNADVDLNINKEGDIVGLSITVHPEPINVHLQVGPANVTVTKDEK